MLTVAAVGGCAPLLDANFDGDTVGSLPNANPPGDPVGDMVWVASTESDDAASTAVIVADGISGNNLQYSNINVPSLLKEFRFSSKETDLSGDTYSGC